jgi:drug/metabolite transporter (DMT)-like permease
MGETRSAAFATGSLGAALAPRAALVLVYLGVVQLGVAYVLLARGLKRVPASKASLISMLEPALNPVWVFLGVGERPGPWALLGGSVVIASVALRTLVGDRSRSARAARNNNPR